MYLKFSTYPDSGFQFGISIMIRSDQSAFPVPSILTSISISSRKGSWVTTMVLPNAITTRFVGV